MAAADGNNEKIQATKDFVDMVTSAYEHSKALPSTDPRRHELLGTCCFVLGCFHIESTKTIMKLGCANWVVLLIKLILLTLYFVDQILTAQNIARCPLTSNLSGGCCERWFPAFCRRLRLPKLLSSSRKRWMSTTTTRRQQRYGNHLCFLPKKLIVRSNAPHFTLRASSVCNAWTIFALPCSAC